jgi:hypothetical protein
MKRPGVLSLPFQLVFHAYMYSFSFRPASTPATSAAAIHHPVEADQAGAKLLDVDPTSAGNPGHDEAAPAAAVVFTAVVDLVAFASAPDGQAGPAVPAQPADDAGLAHCPRSHPDPHQRGNGSCSRPGENLKKKTFFVSSPTKRLNKLVRLSREPLVKRKAWYS